MGEEKRRYERLVIPGDVMISHHESIIKCWIENISNYGAYLKVGSPIDPPHVEIGDNVTFKVSASSIPEQEVSGQILRRCLEGEHAYLAVYFIQPYAFD